MLSWAKWCRWPFSSSQDFQFGLREALLKMAQNLLIHKVFMHQWSTKVVMDPAFESTNWLIQKLHWLFSVPVFDAISMTTRMIILKELVSKTTADWWWLVAMTGLWLSRNTWEWNVIIPTDDWLINIFQRGRLKPPTSHSHMFFFQ